MRRWIASALLIVAAALLWLRHGAQRVAAPAIAAEPARALLVAPASTGPGAIEDIPVEAPPEPVRVAAVPASEALATAPLDEPPPNVLEVRVFGADGMPWVDGELRIRAARSPILPERRPTFPVTMDASDDNVWMARFHVRERSTPDGVYTAYVTDREGRVRILGVAPEQVFALLAVDELGGEGGRSDQPPMHPSEERAVTLHLARFPQPLRGSCALADGRPVAQAEVVLRERGGTLRVASDANGRFATPPLFAQRLFVQARHPEHGLATLFDVDPGLGPVVLQLLPTRSLSVRLVGERGGNPSTQWMRLRALPDGPDVAGPPAVLDGQYVFKEIPSGPLTLVLEHPAPRRVLAVDAGIESLTWTVPEQGEVVLSLDALPGREDGSFALEFCALDGPQTPCDVWPLRSLESQDVRQTLWSGTYAVRVLFVPYAAPDRPVPWGALAKVGIRAGESTHALLGH